MQNETLYIYSCAAARWWCDLLLCHESPRSLSWPQPAACYRPSCSLPPAAASVSAQQPHLPAVALPAGLLLLRPLPALLLALGPVVRLAGHLRSRQAASLAARAGRKGERS